MAKGLLNGYKIGGDIIDRVTDPGRPVAESVLVIPAVSPDQNSGDASPESHPAGAKPEAVKAADSLSPEPAAELLQRVYQDGLFMVFDQGEVSYRVGGVKPVFVTSLRVNIRARQAHKSWYDSLDLYSSKGRAGFALALNRAWGIEPKRVEKDLVWILETLEHQRDEALAASREKPAIVVSPEDQAAAMAFLQSPRLFDQVASDLSELGYVGEDLNKQLLYLCASSRKMPDPISVLILSQSASGKSFLVESVKKLIPPEDVVAVTSLSDQALNYLDDLMHKFLILGEAVHGEVVEHQIREMLSGKELSRMVTIKDPETGKMQSRIVRTPVVVASVMSGTSHQINPENASRAFIVNTDESRDQTMRIHQEQRRKYSLQRLKQGKTQKERIIRTHQAAQRLLQPVHIVNDFAPLLDFPVNLMRLRRDHDRFLDLIACVAYVRQFQKEREEEAGQAFVRCDLTDYQIAWRIMVEGVLSSTVRELPKGAVGLFEDLATWVRQEALRQGLQGHELSFTQRQVREVTGLSHTWVQQALKTLVDYEYLSLVRGGGPRSKGHYRLSGDGIIGSADLSMIPTPQVMATLWEAKP